MTTEKERKFLEYHDANPEVFKLFTRFALQMLGTGRKRYSARTIFHRMRWHTDLRAKDEAGFKINDHHSPYYSLLLESTRPEFKDFFFHRGDVKLMFTRELPLEAGK